MSDRKLKLVVHGEWGSGKSWLADTAPGPRLILDAEGGVDFTPSRKVKWDLARSNTAPPELGPDDSAVVTVTDMDIVVKVHQWLTQSAHPFRSIVVDSLTEMQMRLKDRIKTPGQQMKQNDWGELGDRTLALIRMFRDYTLGIHPVDVVVIVCGSAEKGESNPVIRPMLQGSAAEKIMGYTDVGAYLSIQQDGDGTVERRALFAQLDGVAAKDRTGRLGVTMDGPTIPAMLNLIYGPEEEKRSG
jgi:hypothetical protein